VCVAVQNADSKLRMLRSVWNVCDLLSFVPPLLDVALRATGTPFGCVCLPACLPACDPVTL
jgi:hypothetical protein